MKRRGASDAGDAMRTPWWEVANEIRRTRDAKEWATEDKTFGHWLEKRASALHKSPTQIRRYVTSLGFIERLVASGRVPSFQFAASIPEVTLDALSRLDHISTQTVDRFLARAHSSGFSYREVLRELGALSKSNPEKLDKRRAARREPAWFEEACLVALRDNIKLFAAREIVKLRKAPWGIRVDALLLRPNSTAYDACEFNAGLQSSTECVELARSISWSAKFVEVYWIWLPASDSRVQELLELLDLAELKNIGVVILDPDKSGLRLVRKPEREHSPQLAKARSRFLRRIESLV
jgi:hypothetical protein